MIRLTNQYKNFKIPRLNYFKIDLKPVFSCLEIRGVGCIFLQIFSSSKFLVFVVNMPKKNTH